MGTFFSLLRRHGLKMWGINLLGSLIMMAAIFVMEIIFYFIGVVALLASVGIGVSVVGADNLDQAFSSASVGVILLVVLFFILIYLLTFLIQSFHSAGSIGLATEAVLDDSTSLNSYFRFATRYLWKMFLLSILLLLVSLPILIPWGIVDLGMSYASEIDSTLLFFLCGAIWLLLLVAMILFGSFLLYSPYIMISENMRPWQSIRHSIRAARKSYGKAFGTLLILLAAVAPFIIVYGLLAGASLLPIILAPDNAGVGTILGLLLLGLVFFLTFPLVQVISNLIISLRYKQHLRKWVIPEEPEPAPTEPYKQEVPMSDQDPYNYREEPLSQPHEPDPFLPPEEHQQDRDYSRNSADPNDPWDPYHR
ncbi:hypothetical protein GCM10007416_13010 [Kroppenstedtia guangzhouensis]|uniref:Membrane domain of glycerophosphoryl diester phosphodiesterase n=1 Tax=Kroppenstedtia guangzhouensis TaxID=1274356 RepID=A0ABQ1GD98_9BACL|nr:hypothetical protein [Kroppenstedtia guangzhouensis]GGA41409.1 hypothetical protein GCM10007416_13010 [Kroppenstedtia guangzhouensis]